VTQPSVLVVGLVRQRSRDLVHVEAGQVEQYRSVEPRFAWNPAPTTWAGTTLGRIPIRE
jgi:hypothetical protein